MDVQKRAAVAMSGLLLTGAAALTLGAATPASAATNPAPQAVTSGYGHGHGHDDGDEVEGNQQVNQQNLGTGDAKIKDLKNKND